MNTHGYMIQHVRWPLVVQVGFNIRLSSTPWVRGVKLMETMRSQLVRLDEFGSSSLMTQAGVVRWRVSLQLRSLVQDAEAGLSVE